MKSKFYLIALLCGALALPVPGNAAEKEPTPPPPPGKAGGPQEDLMALIEKIKAKLADQKKTEKELEPELKAFDGLLEKYKGQKTDEVGQILFMKALLYVQIFDNEEKGVELFKQLKKDFPDSAQGKKVDEILENIAKQSEAKKIQRSLVEGAKFPDFEEKDVDGKPISVGKYKGKVVLVDFWATWCGPCINELPNVLETYEKHHGKGFEIVGISLDKEEETMRTFTKKRNMPWQQFCDSKGWGNKLAGKYGVNSIPATYLLDGEGKIIAKDLRGKDLEAAVAKALAK